MKMYSSLIYDVELNLNSGVVIVKGRKNHVLETTHDFMTDITDAQWLDIQTKHSDLVANGVWWAEKSTQSANAHGVDADAEFSEFENRPKTAEELDKELSSVTKPSNRRKKVS